MKKIGISKTAFTMAGCFLGAGFVSGQELWQFFGSFGKIGLIGVLISNALLGLFTYFTVRVAFLSGVSDIDKTISPVNNTAVLTVAEAVELAFMYCIYIVMTAGAGTLIEQMTGSFILRIVFSAAFVGAVTVASIKGIGGAVKIFSFAVPVLVAVSVAVSVCIMIKHGFTLPVSKHGSSDNPLLGNWLFSGLTYVSYNYFCAVGTIAGIGKISQSKTRSALGAVLGTVLLLAVAFSVILAIFSFPSSAEDEIPLYTLASEFGTPVKIIVAITLLIAMFGASLSVYAPIPFETEHKLKGYVKPVPIAVTGSILCLIFSLLGFGELIGII